VEDGDRGRGAIVIGRVDVGDRPRHSHLPFPLEAQQPTCHRGGMGGGSTMLHRFGQRLPGGPAEQRASGLLGRGSEYGEDAASHASLAHPREVEMATTATTEQIPVVGARQGVVVAVEDGKHGGRKVVTSTLPLASVATRVDTDTVPSVAVDPSHAASDGKDARRAAPRSGQADWEPASRDPAEILARQDESRVPELVPIRYERMLASPFTFFRGGAAIMAADLATTPSAGLEAQLCGDAHLSNFGIFSAPDRQLVFDCNDFDETCRGPFEWDVKRLAASVAIAGRERGFTAKERRKTVRQAVSSYRASMWRFAAMRNLDVWYSRLDVEPALEVLRSQVDERRYRRVERNLAKARGKDSLRALQKLTNEVNGELRIVSDPPLITPIEELADGPEAEAQLQLVLDAYRESLTHDRRHLAGSYRYVHAARKVVGVGSVGTRAWIVLLLGRDSGDPLFLQAKEAQTSVLEPFAGPSPYRNHGRRVVEGQRLMQAASDVFLGWVATKGLDDERRCFYVRQLWDGKGSAEVERMSPPDLTIYASLCGEALARAHARSGDRIAIASYLGKGDSFDQALASFAESYADQNERDFQRVKEAAAP
jgi:uncharacterized protein (DUF2252 family)